MADFDPKNLSAADREFLRAGLDLDGDGKITDTDLRRLAATDGNELDISVNEMTMRAMRSDAYKKDFAGSKQTGVQGQSAEYADKILKIAHAYAEKENGKVVVLEDRTSVSDLKAAVIKAGLFGEGENMADQDNPNTPPESITLSERRLPEKPLKIAIGLFDMDGSKSVTMADLKAISKDGETLTREDLVALVDEKIKIVPQKDRAKIREASITFIDESLLNDSKGDNPSVTLEQMQKKLGALGVMMTLKTGMSVDDIHLSPQHLAIMRQLFETNNMPGLTSSDLKGISPKKGGSITMDDLSKLFDEKAKDVPDAGEAKGRFMSIASQYLMMKNGARQESITPEELQQKLTAIGVMPKIPEKLEGKALQGLGVLLDAMGEARGTPLDGKISKEAYTRVAGTDGRITGDDLRAAFVAAAPKPKNKQEGLKALAAANIIIDDMIMQGNVSLTKKEFSDRLQAIGISGGVEGIPGSQEHSLPSLPAGGPRRR